MSASLLHQRFKATTAMSPLQFQKQLRLQEARRLMLMDGLEAASASHRVGYGSPSQFSREYRRLFGSRAVLFLSSVAFMGGTVAFASAASAPMLIWGRALQGIGEGIVVACCYALIPELFPRRLVPQIFAIESVVWVLAAFGGPLVAGAIAEAASWRAAVLVNIPASVAFVILVPFRVPAGRAAAKATLTGMPIPQLGLIVLGIFLLSAGGVAGHRLLSVLIMGGAGLVLGLAVLVDSRSAARVFPTNAFRLSDPMGAGLLLVLLLSITEAPASVYAAFMGQKLWSLNAVEAGTLSATIAISWSLTALAVAHAPRFTASTYVWPAPLILATGLAGNVVALGFASLPAGIVGQTLIGASFGLSWARLCERVMDAAPVAERDFAASALPTVLSAGLAIGAAFFGALAGWSNLKADDSATSRLGTRQGSRTSSPATCSSGFTTSRTVRAATWTCAISAMSTAGNSTS